MQERYFRWRDYSIQALLRVDERGTMRICLFRTSKHVSYIYVTNSNEVLDLLAYDSSPRHWNSDHNLCHLVN